MVDHTTTSPKTTKLIGSANETDIQINGHKTTALLDTGSTISTVSEHFYSNHLKAVDCPLLPLENFLHIEGAGGHSLPYTGYIEADIQIPGITDGNGLTSLFLVVPNTSYNSSVPFLIGTNILTHLMDKLKHKHGVRFLQRANLTSTLQLAFRCMVTDSRRLKKDGHLGEIKYASSKPITIQGNRTVTIDGRVTRSKKNGVWSAMIQESLDTHLPADIEVTPSLVTYDANRDQTVTVQLANLRNQPITIQPRTMICHLKAVEVVDEHTEHEVMKDMPPHCSEFLDKIDFNDTAVEGQKLHDLKHFIRTWSHVFSQHDLDVGSTDAVKHRIELDNTTPFKQRHRRIPPSMYQEVKEHIQELINGGIVRKSHSPWASNIVLVRKKDNSLRMCVDFRQLNKRTIKDSYALPRTEELFDCLKGAKYFSVLDMKSGYHQVEMDESHKSRTAFTVGPLGFYEFQRMPFGLTNAPATYQRLMEDCLGDLNHTICVIFLDDVIVFSNTYEEHIERLSMVFRKLEEYNLKLSPKKCKFLQERVKYVGHIVSSKGVETDPDKIEKVINWPRPTNHDEVRQFLGFVGYYRRFVKDFSKIAKPLNELLVGIQNKRKSRRRKKDSSSPSWKWETEEEEAFQRLKTSLTTPEILAYPDYSLPFNLHIDASGKGLGAVLYQKQEGQERVIAFASRGLTKAERNYPAHKREFLSLKWSVTEKFHDYLYGREFSVYTDNNPLTYILGNAKVYATGQRWLATLANYTFNLRYRPGKSNVDADLLSRHPSIEENLTVDTVKAICKSHHSTCHAEVICMSAQSLDLPEDRESTVNWRRAQRNDPNIAPIIQYVTEGRHPAPKETSLDKEGLILLRELKHLVCRRGILYKEIQAEGETKRQLILPVLQKTSTQYVT